MSNRIYSPLTNKLVDKNSPEGQKLIELQNYCKKCNDKNKIPNTETGKCVKKTGKLGLKLNAQIALCDNFLRGDAIKTEKEIINNLMQIELPSNITKNIAKELFKDSKKIIKPKVLNVKDLLENVKVSQVIKSFNLASAARLDIKHKTLRDFINKLPSLIWTIITLNSKNPGLSDFLFKKFNIILEKTKQKSLSAILPAIAYLSKMNPEFTQFFQKMSIKKFLVTITAIIAFFSKIFKNLEYSKTLFSIFTIPLSLIFSNEKDTILSSVLKTGSKEHQHNLEVFFNGIDEETNFYFQLGLYQDKFKGIGPFPDPKEFVTKYKQQIITTNKKIIEEYQLLKMKKDTMEWEIDNEKLGLPKIKRMGVFYVSQPETNKSSKYIQYTIPKVIKRPVVMYQLVGETKFNYMYIDKLPKIQQTKSLLYDNNLEIGSISINDININDYGTIKAELGLPKINDSIINKPIASIGIFDNTIETLKNIPVEIRTPQLEVELIDSILKKYEIEESFENLTKPEKSRLEKIIQEK